MVKYNLLFKKRWVLIVIVFVSMVVSVFPRNPFMNHISSNWRSSQTLLTSFWFQKEGINLLHPQLPVYGPPWEIPFEFPLYQAISTMGSNISGLNLTASSRVVSAASFYISALFLLLLCLEFLNNKFLSLLIFFIYLILPYNIRFSTEILIDYSSLALALGYIFWIKKFFDSPNNILYFFLAVLFGCLGALIKITTMAIIIIPAILITLNGIKKWGYKFPDFLNPKVFLLKIGKQKLQFLLLILIAILPILSIILWTRYSDGIKQANIFTSWLTSSSLTDWNYGSLGQKLSFQNWWKWLKNINNYFFLGGILLVLPILGMVFCYKMPFKNRVFFVSSLTSIFLTIFIFFNLYRHDYYYIAVSANVCVLLGFGIYYPAKFLTPQKTAWILFSGIYLFFIIMAGNDQYRAIRTQVQAEDNHRKTAIIPLANSAAALTQEDEYIISFQSGWYPDFFLYAQRKGLVISPKEDSKYSCELVTKYNYSTIVVVDRPPDTPKLLGIFGCFKSVVEAEKGIYKIIR